MTCPLCGKRHRYKHSTVNLKAFYLMNDWRFESSTHFFPVWRKLPDQHWFNVHVAEKLARRDEEVQIMLMKLFPTGVVV